MNKSFQNERIKNTVVYFLKHAEVKDDIDLFKLLYLLDFGHFSQTGRSVTGLDYEAWQVGPVPPELITKLHILKADFAELGSNVEFDKATFTPEQMDIMEALCQRYPKNLPRPPIDITREQNGAWSTVWDKGKGEHMLIPYELSIPDDEPNRDLILESALEARGFARPLDDGEY